MVSVFDIFKVGIGPSSSHTMGPMKAAKSFICELIDANLLKDVEEIKADLYGSLSLTGKGHRTDIAVLLGLSGFEAKSVVIEDIDSIVQEIKDKSVIDVCNGMHKVRFPFGTNMVFHKKFLDLHQNGMTLSAYSKSGLIYTNTYYSIGGGVIKTEADFSKEDEKVEIEVPFPYGSAKELLRHCYSSGSTIAEVTLQNELIFRSMGRIKRELKEIYDTMVECIERGMSREGSLPGGLRLSRRASSLKKRLLSDNNSGYDPMSVFDWVNMYALSVSEENASGGRVVTAPTNGACGILPAVLAYYNKFVEKVDEKVYTPYFLSSGAIGGLYTMNASISGAEVGCQGEIGVACSMAAAGLAELMKGSTPERVCMAAEIGMEHNLGLTCDPVMGLVQIPCIERNAIASVKAINSARMAISRTIDSKVGLDDIIYTMYKTGKDMSSKYKETSEGGLAETLKSSL